MKWRPVHFPAFSSLFFSQEAPLSKQVNIFLFFPLTTTLSLRLAEIASLFSFTSLSLTRRVFQDYTRFLFSVSISLPICRRFSIYLSISNQSVYLSASSPLSSRSSSLSFPSFLLPCFSSVDVFLPICMGHCVLMTRVCEERSRWLTCTWSWKRRKIDTSTEGQLKMLKTGKESSLSHVLSMSGISITTRQKISSTRWEWRASLTRRPTSSSPLFSSLDSPLAGRMPFYSLSFAIPPSSRERRRMPGEGGFCVVDESLRYTREIPLYFCSCLLSLYHSLTPPYSPPLFRNLVFLFLSFVSPSSSLLSLASFLMCSTCVRAHT